MQATNVFSARGPTLHVTPVRLEIPGRTVVAQSGLEDADKPLPQSRIFNRYDGLNPVGEVAPPPVCAANKHLGCAVIMEVVDAVVLQKPAKDAYHSDGLTVAFKSRS